MVHLKNVALKALWFLSVFAIAWFSYDVRDFWLAHQPYAYTVAPGSLQWEPPVYNWDESRSGLILADYFTPFGGLPPADGTTVCASGTASSICNPITANLNVNSASWTLTDQALTTGATFASSATTNDVVAYNHTCAGCTASAAGAAGGVVGIANPNVANVNTMSFTGGTATTPYIFEFVGTASKPEVEFRIDGTCTGAQKALFFQNAGNTNWFVTCSGNMSTAGSTPLTFSNTGTNEVDSNSTGTTIPFMLVSSNASAPTQPWFQLCYTSGGGSCAAIKFEVLNNGAAIASPTINATQVTTTLIPMFTSATGTGDITGKVHCVQGSAGSVALSNHATVTLTNNAVFTSATSYSVAVSDGDTTANTTIGSAWASQQAATSFQVNNADATSAHTLVYLACGT